MITIVSEPLGAVKMIKKKQNKTLKDRFLIHWGKKNCYNSK